jgi:hypothetical protein
MDNTQRYDAWATSIAVNAAKLCAELIHRDNAIDEAYKYLDQVESDARKIRRMLNEDKKNRR